MKKIYKLILMALLFARPLFANVQIIEVEDFEFDPAVITMNVGDTVTWLWDAGVHTTTSTIIPAGATSWDQAIDQTNLIFTYILQVEGSYDYICTFHASMGMVGHITVLGNTSVPEASSSDHRLLFNIVNESIGVAIPSEGKWAIELLDIAGRNVKNFYFLSTTRSNEYFPVDELSKGMYLVRISNGKEESIESIVKK